MNELTEQKEVLNDTNPTITFKAPAADKNKITAKATELGMSLSEYIRIKLLLEEPELNAIIRENKELKQQAKENLVKMDIHSINKPGRDTFTLLTTPDGMELTCQILDDIKYEEDLMLNDEIDDSNIGCALSIIVAQRLYRALEPMRGLKRKYGVNNFEQFYKLLFKPYYSKVYLELRPIEIRIEDIED
jgi:hypothetical protein